jgi:hypothetical protein
VGVLGLGVVGLVTVGTVKEMEGLEDAEAIVEAVVAMRVEGPAVTLLAGWVELVEILVKEGGTTRRDSSFSTLGSPRLRRSRRTWLRDVISVFSERI